MSDFNQAEQEKSMLRWGGLSGISGAVLSIAVMVFVGIFIPSDPASLEGWVSRFPDIQTARTIENLMYLMALILQLPLIAALFYALKSRSLAFSLFGSLFSILGLASMLVSAAPHIAHARIYNAGISDQAAVAHLWQALWGVFDEMLYIGFLTAPLGFILLGTAMFRTSGFGRSFGLTGLILGLLGFSAAILQIVSPGSAFGAISFFSIILFSMIFGIRTFRLSGI